MKLIGKNGLSRFIEIALLVMLVLIPLVVASLHAVSGDPELFRLDGGADLLAGTGDHAQRQPQLCVFGRYGATDARDGG